MPSIMKTLGIDRLSVDQRQQLADELLESLDAEGAARELTPAQRADLDRRIAEYDADPGAGSSWNEVKKRLRSLP